MCSVGRSLDQIKSVWRRLRGVLLCLFVNVRRPGLNLVTLWAPADSKTIVTFQKISFSEIHFTQKRNNETWITFHQCFSRLVHIYTDQKTGIFCIFANFRLFAMGRELCWWKTCIWRRTLDRCNKTYWECNNESSLLERKSGKTMKSLT